MSQNTRPDNFPFVRSQSAESSFTHQPRLLLTPNSSTVSEEPSLQRRTMDGARLLRDNLHDVMREIQPLVETARTINAEYISFLNRPVAQSEPNIARSAGSPLNESFVINLDNLDAPRPANLSPNTEMHNRAAALLNSVVENNRPGNEENGTEREQAQQILGEILKYFPFVFILIAKGVYDNHEGIFKIVVLLATFIHANSVVKKEAVKRARRSLSKLLLALAYIVVCIVFINYIFESEKLYLNLIFIRTYNKVLSAWDLLWFVAVTDFILKLLTVATKIVITLLPASVISYQKRGKVYLFIEAVSQLYRSLATIQPWLYYLLESYQGPEKIVGVFLSAFYMVSKGADIMSRLKLLRIASFKLLQNVTVGSSPSKEQMQTAGEHCPICHDEYDSPVLLHCRHIFCEGCVSTWFDREQTCPLCRAKIVDDPSWRDGSTTFFMQLF